MNRPRLSREEYEVVKMFREERTSKKQMSIREGEEWEKENILAYKLSLRAFRVMFPTYPREVVERVFKQLEGVLNDFGWEWETIEAEHGSFSYFVVFGESYVFTSGKPGENLKPCGEKALISPSNGRYKKYYKRLMTEATRWGCYLLDCEIRGQREMIKAKVKTYGWYEEGTASKKRIFAEWIDYLRDTEHLVKGRALERP